MQQKTMIIAIIAAAIIVVAGCAAALTVIGGDDKEVEVNPDESSIRLRIYGNANGDDYINNDDIKIVQKIIDENIVDWKKTYYFADADHDGKITENDIDVIKKIINGEKTKMWYENCFSTKDKLDGSNDRIDSYVNYPIGTKVGCEYLALDLLNALGVYNYMTAVDASTASIYDDSTYPGVRSLPVIGPKDGFDLESLAKLHKNGTIETVVMWTGGTATNYLWDTAQKSGLADEISFVMVPCQGKNCVNGVLMLACMFGDQALSEKYVKWYDKGLDRLDKIGDTVDKKTVLVVQMFNNTTKSGLQAYKQYQSPALWFSEIVNFVENTAGNKGFLKLGSAEARQAQLEQYNTSEMIVMTQPSADDTYENYNSWVEKKMNELFVNLPIYENQKIYTIDFTLMPFLGGPAACYLLAAQLYPDAFSMEDAFAFVQEYIDNFMPVKHDAHYGFTYTGDGYYPYKG